MMFQLPPHVEALRCMAIERLWDGDHGREVMPHLMELIMGYCQKPTISLDCPREEILLTNQSWTLSPFIFKDNGILYGVGREQDNKLTLQTICHDKDAHLPLKTVLCRDSEEHDWFCCYDETTRILYTLYNRGDTTLTRYSMATNEGEMVTKIPFLDTHDSTVGGIVATEGGLFICTGSSYWMEHRNMSRYTVALFYINLTKPDKLVAVFSESREGSLSAMKLTTVPSSPKAIFFYYEIDAFWCRVKVEVIREDSPALFTKQRDETFNSRNLQGLHVQIVGLDVSCFVSSRGPRLIDPVSLEEMAEIHGYGVSLPEPIVFDRWTISCINGDPECLIRYHPYLR
ncbi:hypothetical protein FOL47_000193 [Perkinsus chesapeaki]|uniref:Uncharacterized protein n=1 Tax=Perkinsus chesapeaki TaxID=330153 RepID=A0A7J6MMH9_PERCH|nr:hypothetical protein FOL47_000193 [Perkinsus chesapeaki]